jgi:hypothetical protein
MEVRELRVGVWAKESKFSSRRNTDQPFQVTVQDIVYSQFLEPIPLTVEWLERFGFRQEVSTWRGVWMLDRTMMVRREPEDDSYYMAPFYPQGKCKYVHQLQNLFQALTGEELIIKAPNPGGD